MKVKFKDIKYQEGEAFTFTAKRFYENKYFGMFVNHYRFPNLSKNQNRYLFKQFWDKGTVAAFIIEGTAKEPSLKQLLSNSSPNTIDPSNEESGVLCLVPYACAKYNIEDAPSVITYVNTRGATFIPNTMKKVNVDCVIGWAHSSHAPIRSLVMYYIERIVDVENTINVNLFVHKLPRLIVCSPEDKARVEELMDRIEAGDKKLFLSADDVAAIKNVLESGAGTSYIIDKLYQYKQNLENELHTFLGFNNVPVEKAERLITAEADSNNEVIEECSNCFTSCLDDFAEECLDVLGYDLGQLEVVEPEEEEKPQEKPTQEEEDNND